MFRLMKLGIGLLGLVAFAWFGLTVKLGSHTLFQHLHAIGDSKESQDLVDGTKQVVSPLVDDARRRIGGSQEAALHPDGGAPQEHVSHADRQALHRLIRRVDR
jgi:hypothetical protein